MIIHPPRSSSDAIVGMSEEEQTHSITVTSKQSFGTTTPSLTINIEEEDSTEESFYADDDSICANGCELPVSPREPSRLSIQSSGEESEINDDIVQDLEELDKKSNTLRIQQLPVEASTEASTPSLVRRPLKSSLRSSSRSNSSSSTSNIRLKRKPRVHGLWNEDKSTNLFAMLHDPLLLQIFTSFLDLQDLCRCQGVSQRFASLAQHEEAWRHIDATSFIEASYQHFRCQKHRNPSQATTELLVQTWQSKAPVSIRVENIGNRLEANSFCLPTNTKRLQILTLSQFDDLTDTHVHVLLLSSKTARGSALPAAATNNTTPATARSRSRINRRRSSMTHPLALQRLALMDCPRLTNASLRSVASMCHQLRELNVAGCRLIDNVAAVEPLWKFLPRARDDASESGSARMAGFFTLSARSADSLSCPGSSTASGHASSAPNVTKTADLGNLSHKGAPSLSSLFAPPPTAAAIGKKPAAAASFPQNVKKKDSLKSLVAPPPPPQERAPEGGLSSLFATPSAAASSKLIAASPSPNVKNTTSLASLGGLFGPPRTAPRRPSTSFTNGLSGLVAPPALPFSQNNTPPTLRLNPSSNHVATTKNLGSSFLPPVNAATKSHPTNTTTNAPPSTSDGAQDSFIATPGPADTVTSNADIYSSIKNNPTTTTTTRSKSMTSMLSNLSSSLPSLDQAPKLRVGKELRRLDVSHTGVTPDMLIRCLTEAAAQAADSGFVVALESLTAANSGGSKDFLWNDRHLCELSRVVDAAALKHFDISCYDADAANAADTGVNGRVTDAGLWSLFFGTTENDCSSFSAAANAPVLQLEELNLMGHSLVTTGVLEHIRDASAATNLTVRL